MRWLQDYHQDKIFQGHFLKKKDTKNKNYSQLFQLNSTLKATNLVSIMIGIQVNPWIDQKSEGS